MTNLTENYNLTQVNHDRLQVVNPTLLAHMFATYKTTLGFNAFTVHNVTAEDVTACNVELDNIQKFDTEQDAFDWMHEKVNDGCIDNNRLAYTDDEDAVILYDKATDHGCCGFFDTLVIINGRDAMIGCNFGH